MPVFTIHTNVQKIPPTFLKETSQLVAKLLGKPESVRNTKIFEWGGVVSGTSPSYVSVHAVGGQLMTFGGTDEPCATVNLASIGSIGGDKNKKLSKAISEHLSKTLGISNNRYYINFVDLEGENVGYGGATF